MQLRPEPLTKRAFAPFGDVIEREGADVRVINKGFAHRFHDLAAITTSDGGGKTVVSLFEATRRPMPFVIDMMEHHPLGSQAFFPLSPDDWLVVVAEGDGTRPFRESLRCFRARGDQGVNYRIGVWHFPVLTLVPKQSFLVVDRDGPGRNLVEVDLAPGLEATIDLSGDRLDRRQHRSPRRGYGSISGSQNRTRMAGRRAPVLRDST